LLGHGAAIGPNVIAIDEYLSAVNMNPKVALHEYGVMLLRYEPVYRAVFENKPMRSFLGAFPGLDYWTMLGKAWWHTTELKEARPRFDLVILDGPASGHAVAMLRIPDAVKEAMPKGPLARDASSVRALLSDSKHSSILLVTLPEELPAREVNVLANEIRKLGMPLGPLIVNAMPPVEAIDPNLEKVLAASEVGILPAELTDILGGASVLAARRRDAENILKGFKNSPGLSMLQLPRLPSNNIGPEEIMYLADLLTKSDSDSSLPV
jgi:anion-transporting  ArsA/GET3 family ATPase